MASFEKKSEQSNVSECPSSAAFLALQILSRSERISDDEFFQLKATLQKNLPLDSAIFQKLSFSEKNSYMLAISSSSVRVTINDEFGNPKRDRYNFAKRSSTTSMVKSSSASQLCQICGDDDLSETDGIFCPQRHFLCNSCMTSYVRSLNDDPTDSMFHQRQGRILCPIPRLSMSLVKCGAMFSNGDVCKHVFDCQVLDDFIEGLQNYHKASLAAQYTERLLQNLNEKPNAEKSHERKQLELKQLADCISSTFPDARQCSSCGVGPILMDNSCDNLASHHLQAASGGAKYNNSCRSCGILTSSKSRLPRWNGKLPASLTDSNETTPVTPINRLAELVKDLDLTAKDFESSALRDEMCRQVATSIQSDPAMVTALRNFVQSERQRQITAQNNATNLSTTPAPTPPPPPPAVARVVESALVNPKPRPIRAALARLCEGDFKSSLLAVHIRQHYHLLHPSTPQRTATNCSLCNTNRSSAYYCRKCVFDICNACLGPSRHNRAGVVMYRGNDSTGRYYCGRRLAIRGSATGQCGPNHGPQCPDCL